MLRLLIQGISRPIEHCPEIALKHGALQGISNQPLAVRGKKLIQNAQGLLVRWAGDQIMGFSPKQRVQHIATIFSLVPSLPHIELMVETIPQMIWIGIVD